MNNIPAFPCDLTPYEEDVKQLCNGMTLRDYFAAKAMQGLLAADTGFTLPSVQISEIAYTQADAMMEARK